ncbi:MAG: questin oxidase family protein [Steroidobacteraceae bacterium]
MPQSARNDARRTAEQLIAATRQQSAEYPRVLASHLPMLLEIHCRLGASSRRLLEVADFYNRCNQVPELAAAVAPITRDSWLEALGDRSRECDYRRFFATETERLGGHATIRRYAPELARGIGASALHALMRLAYGVLRNDDAEMATALGYWAATWLPLRDEPRGPPDTDEPLALAAAMQPIAAFRDVEVETDLLWHWMRAVGAKDEFAPLIGRLRIGVDTLERVTRASLALYASTMSFEGLHAMTGSYWVRVISPHIDDPGRLVRYFWQAILAVYPKIGMPTPLDQGQLDALRALTPPPAAAIAAAAVDSDDEHDPSVAFTALQEHARSGDPLYLVLAARRVGLLS